MIKKHHFQDIQKYSTKPLHEHLSSLSVFKNSPSSVWQENLQLSPGWTKSSCVLNLQEWRVVVEPIFSLIGLLEHPMSRFFTFLNTNDG